MQNIEGNSSPIIKTNQVLQDKSEEHRHWQHEYNYKIDKLMNTISTARSYLQFIEALQTFKSDGSISEEITSKWSHITEDEIKYFHKRAEDAEIEGLTLEDFLSFKKALTP